MDVNDAVIRVFDDEAKRAEQIKTLLKGPVDILGAANGLAEDFKRQMNFAEGLGMTSGPAADLMRAVSGPADDLKRQINLADSLGIVSGPAADLMSAVSGPAEDLKRFPNCAEALGTAARLADTIGDMGARLDLVADVNEFGNLISINESLMKNAFEMPSPHLGPIAPLPNIDGGMASGFYERLTKMIAEFESNLDGEHEVGVRLVNFGHEVTFHLSDIGYWNPFLIWFEGETESSDPVKLIQHVHQISVLLMKLPRRPNKPPKRVGFGSGE